MTKTELGKSTTLVALYALLVSGAIFLVFPDQHYDASGWGVLVKYAIYAPLVAGMLIPILCFRRRMDVISLAILATWAMSLALALYAGAPLLRVGLYALPALAILTPTWVREHAPQVAYVVLWTAAIAVVYEIYVLGGLPRFQPSGRYVSIFVNPNNMAITAIALFCMVANRGGKAAVIAFGLTLALVLTSQSKTGLIVLAIVTVLMGARRSARVAAIAAVGAIAALLFALFSERIRFHSLLIRFDQYREFWNTVGLSISPVNGPDLYADNAYIQTWIEMGPLATLVFASAIIWCAFRDRLENPLWVVFGVSALATNINYLFPLAYLFWFYVGARRGERTNPQSPLRWLEPQPSGSNS